MLVPDVYVLEMPSCSQPSTDSVASPAPAYQPIRPKASSGLSSWMRNHPLLTLAGVFFGLLFFATLRIVTVGESRLPHSSAADDSAAETTVAPPPASVPKPTGMDRFRFAMEMDQFLIDKGIESKTTATGPEFTTLQITYALASRETAERLHWAQTNCECRKFRLTK